MVQKEDYKIDKDNISDTCDYRVVHKTTEDGDEWLSVQEVYYDDETKEPLAHTTDLTMEGDTISGIRVVAISDKNPKYKILRKKIKFFVSYKKHSF